MTDKKKKQIREHAERNGMSYQAAYNAMHPGKKAGAPGSGGSSNEEDDDDIGFHENNCALTYWRKDLGEPKPECDCVGIDFSQPLLDGDDYYD